VGGATSAARRTFVFGAALGSVLLAGCGRPGGASGVEQVAQRFVTAVQAHNGTAACALLTATARDSVSGMTDASCPDQIVNVDESGAQVRGVQIWGDAAQVRIGSDVLFLRHISAGWRISAAGCKPEPPRPYNCDVEG
jgi:hypothetical protein